MKKIYEGKTKQVFEGEDNKLMMYFKDDVTGTGDQIDPGGNEVIGQVHGKGVSSFKLTKYFFDLLNTYDIPTHYVSSSVEDRMIEVVEADSFGLEIICRIKAYGSFVKRYPHLVQEFDNLDYLVEITVKDDDLGDPLINEEALVALGVLTRKEVDSIKETTKRASKLISEQLSSEGLDLIDLKFEFGRTDEGILIIDELSGDSMRVFKQGHMLTQQELMNELLG